jgi:dienelactone hydrolase
MKTGKTTVAAALAVAVASGAVQAKVQTSYVEYKEGDTLLQGFLAYDDAQAGKRPGVLVIHEWNGLNPQVEKRAEMLAGLGCVAFAPDIYGKDVRPKNPAESGAEARKYRADRALLRRRANAGLQVLAQNPNVDASKLAAMGYCFGGGAALELARSGAPIVGAVSFHGNLDTPHPDDARNIKGKVLVLHGDDDPAVPREQVEAFRKEMSAAKVDYQFVGYGGAVHSFTNPNAGNDPSKGSAYNERADKRSWEAMKQFFAEIFG